MRVGRNLTLKIFFIYLFRFFPLKMPFFLFSLFRFPNLFLLFLSQTLIFFSFYSSFFSNNSFFLSFLSQIFSTLCITAAGYLVNDIVDRKIDLINKPQKTFVGTHISVRKTWLLYVSLNIVGTVLGFYASLEIGILHFVCILLLVFYSFFFKKMLLLGNFCVAILAGLSIWEIGILFPFFPTKLFFLGLFAANLHFVREIIKDLEDYEGDRQFACQTLATVYPLWVVRYWLYGGFIFLAIGLFFAFMAFPSLPNQIYLAFLFVGIAFLILQIRKANSKADFTVLSRFCKIGLFWGLLWTVIS